VRVGMRVEGSGRGVRDGDGDGREGLRKEESNVYLRPNRTEKDDTA
jgi:hypothetical protein